MSKGKSLVLGLSMSKLGYHHAAWRHPETPPDGIVRLEHYIRTAQTAERGKFHIAFLADGLSMKTEDAPKGSLERIDVMQIEPIVILSALAAVTEKIGLIATASTTYNEPYHIARRFASLDHMSGGRAGWNVVTSWADSESQNFGQDRSSDPALRYERAEEFLDVVEGLWNTWADDAFVYDQAAGQFFDPEKLHILHHKGKHFSVRGPLNMPRPPQGYPVIVSAGASEQGLELAARRANVVYAVSQTLEEAQAFYKAVKSRMPKYGRDPDDAKIMPGLLPVVGSTEEEARRKFTEVQGMLDPLVGLNLLYGLMGDLSGYPLDGPVPELDLSTRGRGRHMLNLARRENLTIRQLYERVAAGRGHRTIVGTPEQIADHMEEWLNNGAADGFNILPLHLPGSLDDFVDMVVPELQRRGLYHTEYQGNTLRENLGVKRPPRQIRTAPSLGIADKNAAQHS